MKSLQTCLIIVAALCFMQCGGSTTSSGSSTSGSTTGTSTGSSSSGSSTSSSTSGSSTGVSTSSEAESFECDFCYESDESTKTEVGILIVGLCERLNQCDNNTSLAPCLFYINDDTSLIQAAGLSSSTYPDFESVQTAVDDSTVTQSLASYAACNNSMPGISCTEFTTANVYDETTEEYGNFSEVISSECSNIFSE